MATHRHQSVGEARLIPGLQTAATAQWHQRYSYRSHWHHWESDTKKRTWFQSTSLKFALPGAHQGRICLLFLQSVKGTCLYLPRLRKNFFYSSSLMYCCPEWKGTSAFSYNSKASSKLMDAGGRPTLAAELPTLGQIISALTCTARCSSEGITNNRRAKETASLGSERGE